MTLPEKADTDPGLPAILDECSTEVDRVPAGALVQEEGRPLSVPSQELNEVELNKARDFWFQWTRGLDWDRLMRRRGAELVESAQSAGRDFVAYAGVAPLPQRQLPLPEAPTVLGRRRGARVRVIRTIVAVMLAMTFVGLLAVLFRELSSRRATAASATIRQPEESAMETAVPESIEHGLRAKESAHSMPATPVTNPAASSSAASTTHAVRVASQEQATSRAGQAVALETSPRPSRTVAASHAETHVSSAVPPGSASPWVIVPER